jgi:hypothetical protein
MCSNAPHESLDTEEELEETLVKTDYELKYHSRNVFEKFTSNH